MNKCKPFCVCFLELMVITNYSKFPFRKEGSDKDSLGRSVFHSRFGFCVGGIGSKADFV